MPERGLYAISDLHISHPENRAYVEKLEPDSPDDWLIVAGDVAERFIDIAWALHTLRSRYAKVIWAPGNHELWTPKSDQVQSRGEQRYRQLVELCRRLDVVTPEDPFEVWHSPEPSSALPPEPGPGSGPRQGPELGPEWEPVAARSADPGPGPTSGVLIAPLFVLYDYSFHPPGAASKREALSAAADAGIMANDEALLHPDPYASREDWCAARVAESERRLAERPAGMPTILVNHFPLTQAPTRALRYPEFAPWCGTTRTADWPKRFDAQVVVYGHLHIPRSDEVGGVRFEEVSVGYPREWARRGGPPRPRLILP